MLLKCPISYWADIASVCRTSEQGYQSKEETCIQLNSQFDRCQEAILELISSLKKTLIVEQFAQYVEDSENKRLLEIIKKEYR